MAERGLGERSASALAVERTGGALEARSEIGVGLWLDRGDEETLLALSAPPEKIDLTGEEDGDAYLCGVAGGEARLYYSAAGGALFEVELEPGTPVDDCAIGSAGAGQIALAFRSGDQILRGLFYSL